MLSPCHASVVPKIPFPFVPNSVYFYISFLLSNFLKAPSLICLKLASDYAESKMAYFFLLNINQNDQKLCQMPLNLASDTDPKINCSQIRIGSCAKCKRSTDPHRTRFMISQQCHAVTSVWTGEPRGLFHVVAVVCLNTHDFICFTEFLQYYQRFASLFLLSLFFATFPVLPYHIGLLIQKVISNNSFI